MTDLLDRFRALKVRFDAIHADGMAALAAHDLVGVSRAIEAEGEVLKEQAHLIELPAQKLRAAGIKR